MAYHFIYFLVSTSVLVFVTNGEVNKFPPKLIDEQGNKVIKYKGTIKNNAAEHVIVDPKIIAFDQDEAGNAGFICGFEIEWKEGQYTEDPEDRNYFPFEIVSDLGYGYKRVAAQLKIRKDAILPLSNYVFYIKAQDCSSNRRFSAKAKVLIRVSKPDKLVGEEEFGGASSSSTGWKTRASVASIHEGRIYDKVIQVEIDSLPASAGRVCDYHITNTDVPFQINRQGVVRNTEALDASKVSEYALNIVAEFCNKTLSSSQPVLIIIERDCSVGWKNFQPEIEFSADHQEAKLFSGHSGGPSSSPKLDLCAFSCPHKPSVTFNISLQTDHIGQGCDRHPLNVRSHLCGVDEKVTTNLLPGQDMSDNLMWTNHLRRDETEHVGQQRQDMVEEGDQSVYLFDGRSAAEVPSARFNHSLASKFSISFQMKHKRPSSAGYTGKQHILCNSDGDGMSRHHYSLYLNKCHLIFLIRKEEPGKEHVPAEFRFILDQFCDSNWHYYTLDVSLPQVELLVDGEKIKKTFDDYDVLDDYPLIKSPRVTFTRLVIGACWQGRTQDMTQFLTGYLSGLMISKGSEHITSKTAKCLHQCQERILYRADDNVDPTVSAVMNAAENELILSGDDVSHVVKQLANVYYVNYRKNPLPGLRPFSIATDLRCDKREARISTESGHLAVGGVESPIDVEEEDDERRPPVVEIVPPYPQTQPDIEIHIRGRGMVLVNLHDMFEGLEVFDGLTVSVSERELVRVKRKDPGVDMIDRLLLKGKVFSEATKQKDDDADDSACYLPAKVGMCRAAFPMFYFDTITATCREFIYGGCGGNKNRFDSMKQCQTTCRYVGERLQKSRGPHLTSCQVKLISSRTTAAAAGGVIDRKKETFMSDKHLTEALKLVLEETDSGLAIQGEATAAVYTAVLRQIRYVNYEPRPFSEVDLTVSCNRSAITSNLFTVQLQSASEVAQSDSSAAAAAATSKNSPTKGGKTSSTKNTDSETTRSTAGVAAGGGEGGGGGAAATVEVKKDDPKSKPTKSAKSKTNQHKRRHIDPADAPAPVAQRYSEGAEEAAAGPDQLNLEVRNFGSSSGGQSKVAASSPNSNNLSPGYIVVIAMCVGFLSLILIVGVVQLRKVMANGAEAGDQMEWDDSDCTGSGSGGDSLHNSTMHLVENPLDEQTQILCNQSEDKSQFFNELCSGGGGVAAVAGGRVNAAAAADGEDDYCDSSDDCDSLYDTEAYQKKARDLEWDESAIC